MNKAPAAPQQLLSAPSLDLRDYFEIIRRRKAVFVQVFFMVLVVGIVATWMSKPVYQTSTRILVPVSTPSVQMFNVSDPITPILQIYQPDTLATQLQVLSSGPFMQEAMERAGLTRPGALKPGVIPPSPHVSQAEGTNSIVITVEGGDPQAITKLANAMVDLHREKTDLNRNQGVVTTIDFVQKELNKKMAELQHAKLQMLTFRKSHRIIQEQSQQEAQAKAYSDLHSRLLEAENELTSAKAQIAQLRTQLVKEPAEVNSEVRNPNPARDVIRKQIAELQTKKSELLADLNETAAPVQELQARIDAAKEQLGKEPAYISETLSLPSKRHSLLEEQLSQLETKVPGLEAEYASLSGKFSAQKQEVEDLGPWELEMARLNAQYDRIQHNVDALSDQLQNLQMRKTASSASPFRVIEQASVPGAPIKPRRSTNLLLAFVLAVVLAGGAALLQEYLDDRVNSPEDVERMTSLPALGHVPLIGPDSPRIVSALPTNSHVAEAYRALRSSVGFASIDTPIRRLQVTSASKGEGKTVTSVNLAAAMAMDGKRVILVDADLRRPSLHRVLQVPNSGGLSEVLAGMKNLEEVIQDTEHENLQVICAGPIPPNPAELLGSRAFDQAIEQLEERCDIVIFDTPPCIPVTDPVIVAARMDGVVLVLHVGQTRKAMMRHAIELLGRARARVLGIVFNRVQSTKSGYYYYHYYYYYGDGYYSEAAERGQRHRNGRKPKPELSSGGAVATLTRPEDRDA